MYLIKESPVVLSETVYLIIVFISYIMCLDPDVCIVSAEANTLVRYILIKPNGPVSTFSSK